MRGRVELNQLRLAGPLLEVFANLAGNWWNDCPPSHVSLVAYSDYATYLLYMCIEISLYPIHTYNYYVSIKNLKYSYVPQFSSLVNYNCICDHDPVRSCHLVML